MFLIIILNSSKFIGNRRPGSRYFASIRLLESVKKLNQTYSPNQVFNGWIRRDQTRNFKLWMT